MKKKSQVSKWKLHDQNNQDQINSAYTQPTQLPLVSLKRKNKE